MKANTRHHHSSEWKFPSTLSRHLH